jgi:hypothetical protein
MASVPSGSSRGAALRRPLVVAVAITVIVAVGLATGPGPAAASDDRPPSPADGGAAVTGPGDRALGPIDRERALARAIEIIDRSNAGFIALKRGPRRGIDPVFDWSDDGCSVPRSVRIVLPPTALGTAVFADQCRQHDFGWRNFGRGLQLDPTPARKWWVDGIFHARMHERCGVWWIRYAGLEPACRLTADAFHLAVSVVPW